MAGHLKLAIEAKYQVVNDLWLDRDLTQALPGRGALRSPEPTAVRSLLRCI